MIVRVPRARAGISLTEILISILILGVGVISLATLFPIGLMRLHAAAKWSRSTYLAESAAGEINTRNLLAKSSFLNPALSPWYFAPSGQYDPMIQDTASAGGDWANGAYRGLGGNGTTLVQPSPPGPRPGTGLYFAYDPLWRQITGFLPERRRGPRGRGSARASASSAPTRAAATPRRTGSSGSRTSTRRSASPFRCPTSSSRPKTACGTTARSRRATP